MWFLFFLSSRKFGRSFFHFYFLQFSSPDDWKWTNFTADCKQRANFLFPTTNFMFMNLFFTHAHAGSHLLPPSLSWNLTVKRSFFFSFKKFDNAQAGKKNIYIYRRYDNKLASRFLATHVLRTTPNNENSRVWKNLVTQSEQR